MLWLSNTNPAVKELEKEIRMSSPRPRQSHRSGGLCAKNRPKRPPRSLGPRLPLPEEAREWALILHARIIAKKIRPAIDKDVRRGLQAHRGKIGRTQTCGHHM